MENLRKTLGDPGTKVTELGAQIAEMEKERDDVKAEAKESDGMALELTLEAFKNGVGQVISLNPGVELRTKEVNPDYLLSRCILYQVSSQFLILAW